MIIIQPSRKLYVRGPIAIGTAPDTGSQSHQLTGGEAAAVFGFIGLFMVGALALGFYKASKGIQDTYVFDDDHHHGGLTIDFGGHHGHHGHHGGLTFAMNRRRGRRRNRRR